MRLLLTGEQLVSGVIWEVCAKISWLAAVVVRCAVCLRQGRKEERVKSEGRETKQRVLHSGTCVTPCTEEQCLICTANSIRPTEPFKNTNRWSAAWYGLKLSSVLGLPFHTEFTFLGIAGRKSWNRRTARCEWSQSPDVDNKGKKPTNLLV